MNDYCFFALYAGHDTSSGVKVSKALAIRLRQAVGLKDPEPTSALLADPDEAQYGETSSNGKRPCDLRGGGKTQAEPPRGGGRRGMSGGSRNESVAGRKEEAWED